MTAFLNLTVPLILPVLFGNRWSSAVVCFHLLSPVLMFGSIGSPLGMVLDVLERQDLHLMREVFRAVVVASGLFVAHSCFGSSWVYGILMIGVTGAVSYSGYILASWIAVERFHKQCASVGRLGSPSACVSGSGRDPATEAL